MSITSKNNLVKLGLLLAIAAMAYFAVMRFKGASADKAGSDQISSSDQMSDAKYAEDQPAGIDIGATTVGPKPTPSGRKNPVYAMLDSGASLDGAISATSGQNGVVTDARIASLVKTASLVCADDVDPYGAVSEKTDSDPTRAWAVVRVAELCHGFDASKYEVASSGPDIPKLLRDYGPDVAASESLKAIRSAPDYSQIYSAGQVLLETGKFPLGEALPNAKAEYGMTEVMTAWAHATTLLTCQEAGGCGPNSLETAAFCSNVGCPVGSDITQAFQKRLPANEYKAVTALHSWLSRQRNS